MSKKGRILGIVLLVAIVGVLAWLVLRPREPVYERRPLSAWLQDYDHLYSGETSDVTRPFVEKADEALRHIGTNAVPTLVRLLQEKDSKWKLQFARLVWRQRFIRIRFTQASALRARAFHGLAALGSEGKAAVPTLIGLLHDTNSSYMRLEVISTLGNMGLASSAALPDLLELPSATNLTYPESLFLTVAITNIHSVPELSVPFLIGQLELYDKARPKPRARFQFSEWPNWPKDGTPIETLAEKSICGLAMFGSQAKQAVPILERLLNDEIVGYDATSALRAIDSEAAAKAGVK